MSRFPLANGVLLLIGGLAFIIIAAFSTASALDRIPLAGIGVVTLVSAWRLYGRAAIDEVRAGRAENAVDE